jgi:hypothetical protein
MQQGLGPVCCTIRTPPDDRDDSQDEQHGWAQREDPEPQDLNRIVALARLDPTGRGQDEDVQNPQTKTAIAHGSSLA